MSIRQFYELFSINNIRISTYVFISAIMITFSVQNLQAQIVVPIETEMLAKSSILSLKEHYLIVRLHTNKNSLDKLNDLASKSTNPNDPYQKQAMKIKEDRDWENKHMIQSMKKHYTFSKVLFIPEDRYEDFLNGSSNKVCLDENLVPVDLEEKPTSFILLSRVLGHHYDWQTLTHEGEVLNDPFPSYFRINNNWDQFIKGVFKPNSKNAPDKYDALAQKISEKMQKYYAKVSY